MFEDVHYKMALFEDVCCKMALRLAFIGSTFEDKLMQVNIFPYNFIIQLLTVTLVEKVICGVEFINVGVTWR